MRRLIAFGLFLIALLLIGVVVFILLPQIVSARLADDLREKSGLSFSQEGRGSLSFETGLGVTLSDVVLATADGQSVPLMTARSMTIPDVFSMFSGAGLPAHILLDEATITLEHRGEGDPPAIPVSLGVPFHVNISNTTLKLTDRQSSIVLAATDVGGEIVRNPDGELLIDARGLVNGQSTQATVSVDRAADLVSEGSPADLAFASGAHTLTFSGRIKAGPMMQLDGVLSVQSDSLRGFLIWLGLPLVEDGRTTPFTLDSPISVEGGGAKLSNMQIGLDGREGTGKVLIRTDTERPQISGELTLPLLNFNVTGTDAMSLPNLAQDWSERPFSFSDLFAVDTDLAVTAERVQAGALTLDKARLGIAGADGSLKVAINSATLAGGALTGLMTFAQDDTEAQLEGDVALTGADANMLLGGQLGIPRLSGTLDLATTFAANGGSPAALISTLKGSGTLNVAQGQVQGFDLATLLERARQAPVNGWIEEPGKDGAFSEAKLAFALADGVATLNDSQIVLAGAPVTLSGTVDLLRRALSLSAAAAGGRPLSVSGPWNAPQFSVAEN